MPRVCESQKLAWLGQMCKTRRVKKFFARNITGVGQFIRFLIGCGFFVGGVFAWRGEIRWLAVFFFIAGAFTWFEAARGWCVARACGVKTKW